MEKRVLFAIVISFFIIYFWTLLNPPAKKQAQSSFSEETTKDLIVESKTASSQDIKEKTSLFVENTLNIYNDRISLDFSNKGGNLKNVYLTSLDHHMPIENVLTVSELNDFEFIVAEKSEDSVKFKYEDKDISISKAFKLSKNDYIVQSDVHIILKSDKYADPNKFKINSFTLNISNNKDVHLKNNDKGLYEYALYNGKDIFRKNNAYKFDDKNIKQSDDKLKWLGFRDRFYCFILYPEFGGLNGYSIEKINDHELEFNFKVNSDVIKQKELSFSSKIYIGPEERHLLKEYGLEFEKIKMYYRNGLFDGIAHFMESVMWFIHRFVPNWGLCIILMGLLVYTATYPLTAKSMNSMKKLQMVQPKINAIREKYKDNPQKMNQELVGIYKNEKINPLGGCLPILFQMPVFIGLYQVLWRSASFKGADFMWIKDLSEPDKVFSFPFIIPFIGKDFNILPIIMMVVMFIQQKISTKNMVMTDPMQAQQQKMMMIIMPIFMCFIFYNFASGLNLYFTVFYSLSALTQWKLLSKSNPV